MISGGTGKTGRGARMMIPAIVLMGILFCAAILPPAGSSQELIISAQQQLDLADSLFDRAEYEPAITEYRRFLFFFPDHFQTDDAAFRIALAFFRSREFEKALPLFEAIYKKDPGNRYAVEARFMASSCHQALGRMELAEAVLRELAESTDNADVRDRVWYHIGWLCLESGASLNPAAVNRAGEFFARISDRHQALYRVGELTGRLKEQVPLAGRKHPGLAGALAVFPGGGYVYCGRYHDALMSCLFIGGMAYAAGEAFHNDLEGLGALIGLVGSGFYAGSIYGSVTAAHKWNRALSRDFLLNLRDIRVDMTSAGREGGAMARVRVSF